MSKLQAQDREPEVCADIAGDLLHDLSRDLDGAAEEAAKTDCGPEANAVRVADAGVGQGSSFCPAATIR